MTDAKEPHLGHVTEEEMFMRVGTPGAARDVLPPRAAGARAFVWGGGRSGGVFTALRASQYFLADVLLWSSVRVRFSGDFLL